MFVQARGAMDRKTELKGITWIAKRTIGVLQLTRRAELWALLAAKCLPPMHAVEWLARVLTLESSRTTSGYTVVYMTLELAYTYSQSESCIYWTHHHFHGFLRLVRVSAFYTSGFQLVLSTWKLVCNLFVQGVIFLLGYPCPFTCNTRMKS